MEDENLYDEFGNYIGPEIDVSGDSDDQEEAANDDGGDSRSPQSSYAYERPVSS